MLPITSMILTNSNRPKKPLKAIRAIVLHWTANTGKGANAKANRNYFNSTTRACSAHYIVDDSTIVQCVPDNELAYHVGANSYTSIGQSLKISGLSPNFSTIGIEMCVNSDGDFNKMYQNTVELVAYLLKKYNLTVTDILTHRLITGKDCPNFIKTDADLAKFRSAVSAILSPAQSYPLLKEGMTGSIVTTMQKLLYAKGQHIPPNGAYDATTKQAVINFQKGAGLEPDGICGAKTWTALSK